MRTTHQHQICKNKEEQPLNSSCGCINNSPQPFSICEFSLNLQILFFLPFSFFFLFFLAPHSYLPPILFFALPHFFQKTLEPPSLRKPVSPLSFFSFLFFLLPLSCLFYILPTPISRIFSFKISSTSLKTWGSGCVGNSMSPLFFFIFLTFLFFIYLLFF